MAGLRKRPRALGPGLATDLDFEPSGASAPHSDSDLRDIESGGGGYDIADAEERIASGGSNTSDSENAAAGAGDTAAQLPPRRMPLFSRRARETEWDAQLEALDEVLPQFPEEDEDAERAANAIVPPVDPLNSAVDDMIDHAPASDAAGGAVLGSASATGSSSGSSGSTDGLEADGSGQSTASAQRRSFPPDRFRLFGDVPAEVLRLGEDRILELSLQNLAATYLIPIAAITALLLLLHGLFGQRLGVLRSLLTRGGGIPRTAKTLFRHANEVTSALGLSDLLRAEKLPLPDDPGLRAWGGRPYVEYYFAPDLRKNIALKLMDPKLSKGFYFDPGASLAAGWACADIYLSPSSKAKRLKAVERARSTLAADIAEQIPGTPTSAVGIIAVGLHSFIDGVSPHKWNLATNVKSFLAAPTNLRTDVSQSPESVALCGMWNSCRVLRAAKASKAAVDDQAVNASPATEAAAARVDAHLYEYVVANPVKQALTAGSLIVHASSLPGLPDDYPYQVRRG